jgi:hypothetical protein
MKILVLPGDGIGPEITAEAVRVLEVLRTDGVKMEFEEGLLGGCAVDATGVGGGEEGGVDQREVFFRTHAIHQHRANHAAPTHHAKLLHCSAPQAALSAAITASPISRVPTLLVPGS